MKKKKLGVCLVLSALAVTGLVGISKLQTNKATLSEAYLYEEDLVTRLEGQAVTEGIVSFAKDGYQFDFLCSGVTIGSGSITIADGGFIKNATAFNQLKTLKVEGTLDNALVSTGTLTSGAINKEVEKVKPTASMALEDDQTHFFLEAKGGEVTLTKLGLCYYCGHDVVTSTSSPWGCAFYFDGLGTALDPIEIKDAADFEKLAEITKTDKCTGVYFELGADIASSKYLSSVASVPFAGNFDGKNHKVTLTVSNTADGVGLVGSANGASIANVTVEGSLAANSKIGGIVGNVVGPVHIDDCVNKANINATSDCLGGIVGINNGEVVGKGLYIDGCENYGNLSSSANSNSSNGFGGIVGNANRGKSETTIEDCINHGDIKTKTSGLGGIIGRSCASAKVVVRNCVNDVEAEIETSQDCSGGILGKALGVTNISGCVNKGTVKVTNTGISSVGGMVGYIEKNTDDVMISSCINKADITGNRFVGGICGRQEKTSGMVKFVNCDNYGTIKTTVGSGGAKTAGIAAGVNSGTAALHTEFIGCNNYGLITSNGSLNGGIAGSAGYFAKFVACANYGKIYSKAGGAGGISGEGLKVATFDNCFNAGEIEAPGERVGGISATITDGGWAFNCVNTGSVTGKGTNNGGVGGITGFFAPGAFEKTYLPFIDGCVNYGAINSTNNNAGGIAGITGYSATVCDGEISNCRNYGAISCTGGTMGGIVGHDAKGTSPMLVKITNCYSAYDLEAANVAKTKGNIVGAIDDALLAGSYVNAKIALEPGEWELSAGESYKAIFKKDSTETTIALVEEEDYFVATQSMVDYDQVKFVIVDGADQVVSATDFMAFGTNEVFTVTETTGVVTGNWHAAPIAGLVTMKAGEFASAGNKFALRLSGANGIKWVAMNLDGDSGEYFANVAARYYDIVEIYRFAESYVMADDASNIAAANACTKQFALAEDDRCFSFISLDGGIAYGNWSL